MNARYRNLLSNDLGAFAGVLFDLGTGRYSLPTLDAGPEARERWEADLIAVREEAGATRKALEAGREGDRTHTEIQGWLRGLGLALGYAVWIASNDRNRPFGGGRLADGCLDALPPGSVPAPALDTVRLIDVLWLDLTGPSVAAAFEVEHTTSIYSGIMRMLDLALGLPDGATSALFLVAPDGREQDVRAQLRRPAFSRIENLDVRYLPYSELDRHRETMARFGTGLKAVEAVARRLV